MNPAYYDTTYLLKLQIVENGTSEVREHASSVREIQTAQHGRAEFISATILAAPDNVQSSLHWRPPAQS